jgi:enoyl-CoA hydratase
MKLREVLLLEATLFGELCESDDKQEGLSAFLEKRTPHFKEL